VIVNDSLANPIVNFFMMFPPIFLIEASLIMFKYLQYLTQVLSEWAGNNSSYQLLALFCLIWLLATG
jgi:hypothetical protein